MLKSVIGKAVQVIDDAGVETVLTLAFVAQFAAYSLPFHTLDGIRVHRIAAESDVVEVVEVVEVGTVVQMPAKPKGRATRTGVVRESENARGSANASIVPKAPRVQRP